eukprot:SAG11_NODE_9_length_28972_cov_81.532539_20_plen_70_part_00
MEDLNTCEGETTELRLKKRSGLRAHSRKLREGVLSASGIAPLGVIGGEGGTVDEAEVPVCRRMAVRAIS